MKIFSGSSNKPLAEKVAQARGHQVSPIDVFIFPDGEKRVRILDSVVGDHAVVVMPTNTPVDQNYMELFFIVDGLKRSGAEFVTAVIPYLGYQRQDHVFRDGEAVSLEVVLKTLKSAGTDTIISVDLHSSRTESASPIPLSHVTALSLFAAEIQELNVSRDEIVLVSPDMGGIRRIKLLSQMLDSMQYAAIEKDRDLSSGSVTAQNFGEGSVAGKKTAIIVDDMISSGKTIIAASDVLVRSGIENIYVFATHAIFSAEAPMLLQGSVAKKVFVTDTVLVEEKKKFEKLEILSVAKLIADNIQ